LGFTLIQATTAADFRSRITEAHIAPCGARAFSITTSERGPRERVVFGEDGMRRAFFAFSWRANAAGTAYRDDEFFRAIAFQNPECVL
jgi:hypothetical protein